MKINPFLLKDVSALERLLTDDVSCGKTPLILIAYAGTPLTGHTDNLSRLREICTQSGVWFHVEGWVINFSWARICQRLSFSLSIRLSIYLFVLPKLSWDNLEPPKMVDFVQSKQTTCMAQSEEAREWREWSWLIILPAPSTVVYSLFWFT